MRDSLRPSRLGLSLAVGYWLLLLHGPAIATDPAGIVSNTILAQGSATERIHEQIRVGDGWAVNLDASDPSDFYFQDLIVGPGGRTGWHSHPGLLMIAIKEGSIDFYDKDCRKRIYSAGQSFTESADPHNAFNTGTINVRLFISYIIKKGEPRRIEQAQPPCAVGLQLP